VGETEEITDVIQRIATLRRQIDRRRKTIAAETSELEKDETRFRESREILWKMLKHRDCVSSGNMGFEVRLEALLCEIVDNG